MKYGITFWKILGIVNSSGGLNALQSGGGGDTGMYGFIGFLALLGPFISQFWKDPLAHLGNCIPLILMIFVAISIYMGIQDGMKSAGNMGEMFGGGEMGKYAQEMMSQMMQAAMKAVHIGPGAYISSVASAYLFLIGARKYLVAKA